MMAHKRATTDLTNETEMMTDLTVEDVLNIVKKRAQQCREDGESDMRAILYLVSYIEHNIKANATREEILKSWEDE